MKGEDRKRMGWALVFWALGSTAMLALWGWLVVGAAGRHPSYGTGILGTSWAILCGLVTGTVRFSWVGLVPAYLVYATCSALLGARANQPQFAEIKNLPLPKTGPTPETLARREAKRAEATRTRQLKWEADRAAGLAAQAEFYSQSVRVADQLDALAEDGYSPKLLLVAPTVAEQLSNDPGERRQAETRIKLRKELGLDQIRRPL